VRQLYQLLCGEFEWRADQIVASNSRDSEFYERLGPRLLTAARRHIERLPAGTTQIDIPSLFERTCPQHDDVWIELYATQASLSDVQQTHQTLTPPLAPLPPAPLSAFMVRSIIVTSNDADVRANEIYDGMLAGFPSYAARQVAVARRENELRYAASIRAAVQGPGEVVDTGNIVDTLFPANDPVWNLEDEPVEAPESHPPSYNRDDRADSAAPSDSDSHSLTFIPSTSPQEVTPPSIPTQHTTHGQPGNFSSSSNTSEAPIRDDSMEYTRHIQSRYTPRTHSRHQPYGPAGSRRDRDDPYGRRISRAYTGERVYCECDDNQLSDREYAMPLRVRRDRRRWAQRLEQHVQYFFVRLYTGLATREDVREFRRRWSTWLARQEWEANYPRSRRARRGFGNNARGVLNRAS
jgi:hypothetical protein